MENLDRLKVNLLRLQEALIKQAAQKQSLDYQPLLSVRFDFGVRLAPFESRVGCFFVGSDDRVCEILGYLVVKLLMRNLDQNLNTILE